MKQGTKIYNLIKLVWSYNRSLTGEGVRKTLAQFKKKNKDLKIFEVKSGTKCFDWQIPLEWIVEDAWIKNSTGKKIIDFKKNNLHLVGYSIPINEKFSLKKLLPYLHSLPLQKNAIPYVTSYYKKIWGFCLTDKQKKNLKKDTYHVNIKSKLKKGSLTYGEILIKGKSNKEILLSSYICHPSLANNELSGPCLLIYLSNWIKNIKNRHYSYRIIFIPETIGSIYYISKHLNKLKKNVKAGYVLTCVGDNRDISYIPSRNENTLSDIIAKHVLKKSNYKFKKYSWLDRGSDERQFCAPGVDLPIASVIRSKYGNFKEYHTSLDKLDTVVTKKGLDKSFEIYTKIIDALENNQVYKNKFLCEPKLDKYNLYPSLSIKNNKSKSTIKIKNLLTYFDGKLDLISICDKLDLSIWDVKEEVKKLIENDLIRKI